MSLVYLDSSAIVKLVRTERETQPLARWLTTRPFRVSSALAEIESRRAALRAEPQSLPIEAVLAGIDLLPIDDEVAAMAGALRAPTLRSLDAIHLATALSLRDELDALVTYDRRLAEAATEAGLTAVAPE